MNADEVLLLLAAPQASGGFASPGSVYNSNGKWASTTQLNEATTLNNLFPDLSGAQNAAGQVDYQCLFAYNTDETDTLTNVWAWIPSTSVTGPVDWAVGADPTGASAHDATGTPQATYITAPTIAPAGVTTWAGPSAAASGGAQLPSIGPGQLAAFWVRRTATNSASFTGAGFNVQVTFDVTG